MLLGVGFIGSLFEIDGLCLRFTLFDDRNLFGFLRRLDGLSVALSGAEDFLEHARNVIKAGGELTALFDGDVNADVAEHDAEDDGNVIAYDGDFRK